MDWCMMKKVKGYLVWMLVFYTVLVTYFLVLTAWSDDVSVKKRQGDDKLINVLYQEEKRHLRSFKDVVKTYGGMMVGMKFNQESHGASGGDTIERRPGETSDNGTGPIPAVAERHMEEGGQPDKPRFTVEVESWEEAVMGKTRRHSQRRNDTGSIDNGNDNDNNNGDNKSDPRNGNIFIEDGVFNAGDNNNSTGDKSAMTNHNNKGEKVSILNSKNKDKWGGGGVVTKGPDVRSKTGTVTEFCDKIDAEQPDLCLTERVTFTHPSHVIITSNHMSFRPIGDLYIYSGFLDTRRKPAFIRFMVIAPRKRDGVKRSGYWCAFNLPAVLSQRFYWNGVKELPSARPDQATPLDYYAASHGHDRKSQFYIMSCAVPAKHLPTLEQFETNRLHVVAGSKESPLLDTVQERIAVDVVNNRGIPWHEMVKRSAVLGKIFQIDKGGDNDNTHNYNNNNNNDNNDINNNAFVNNIKLDGNIHPQSHVLDTRNVNNRSSSRIGTRNNDNNILINKLKPANVPDPLKAFTLGGLPPPTSIVSCVAPIFTTVSVVQMVEFLELTFLLGSQHIVLYTLHMPDDVRDVLAMYRYKGLITVLPWPIPSPAAIWANGRDIALNDCLYRTMYRYEFALFHDMDEFFVPRNTPDLPSFINFLYTKAGMKRNRTSDIIFSSAYFAPPTKAQSQSLTTNSGYTKDVGKFASLRSVHRTYFNSEHSVRMIRPVMAFRVGGGERKRTVFTISSKYAAVNHYSKCVGTLQDSTATKNISVVSNNVGVAASASQKKDSPKSVGVDCGATKVDMHLWRIKDKLIRQTKDSIRDLNSLRKRMEL